MIKINRPIGSSVWDSLFISLALLLSKVFYCLAVSAYILVRIKNIIISIFPITQPSIFCDRTKINPSWNHSPIVETRVTLNKLKNVIVSAVIKSNYFSFHLALHTNWLFIVQ